VDQAIQIALNEFKKEYGENAKIEDGDEFATVFNDGILVISMENKKLSIKIFAGEPYKVDFNLNLLDE
jgi:hypothetical protein